MPARFSSITASTRSTSSSFRSLALLMGLSLALLLTVWYALPSQFLADEVLHVSQILLLLNEQYRVIHSLEMPFGYHASVALFAHIADVRSVSGFRLISTLLCLPLIALAWQYYRSVTPSYPFIQALQILLAPLLWPFYWLLYTDVFTLNFVTLGLLGLTSQTFWLSAITGSAALLIRQHTVCWAALFWLMGLSQRDFFQHARALLNFKNASRSALMQMRNMLRNILIQTSPLAIPLIIFIGFALANSGISMSSSGLQKYALYPTQFYFLLLVLWWVLLPIHLANLFAIIGMLRRWWWAWLIVISALMALYLQSFEISHPYNFRSDYFLRNWLLHFLNDRLRYRILAFIPMVWTLLSLSVALLRRPENYWLYPITLVAILPLWLLEQRYFMAPFFLWLLFRKPASRPFELTLLAWFAANSALLTLAIMSTQYFLWRFTRALTVFLTDTH